MTVHTAQSAVFEGHLEAVLCVVMLTGWSVLTLHNNTLKDSNSDIDIAEEGHGYQSTTAAAEVIARPGYTQGRYDCLGLRG